jgi:hypothetical protein
MKKIIKIITICMAMIMLAFAVQAASVQMKAGDMTINNLNVKEIQGGTNAALLMVNFLVDSNSIIVRSGSFRLGTDSGFSFTNSTTSLVFITNGGNVGIGTINPSKKLEVMGDIKAAGNIEAAGDITASRNITAGRICLSGGSICLASPSQTQQWNTNTVGSVTDYYTLNKVAIGKTAIGANAFSYSDTSLEVSGSIYTTNRIIAGGAGNYFAGSVLTRGMLTVGSASGGEIKLVGPSNFSIISRPNGKLVVSDASEHSMLTVLSNGTVGVGTETSQGELDVYGNIAATGSIAAASVCTTDTPSICLEEPQWSVSGSDVYRTTGNVGIGTTDPNASLDVNGNVNITGNVTIINGNLHKFIPNASCAAGLVKNTIYNMYGGLYFDACDMGPGTWKTAFADCAKRGGMLPPTAYFYSLSLSSLTNYFSINTNYWTNDAFYASVSGSVTVQYGTIVVTQGGNNYYSFGLANNYPDSTTYNNKPIKWRCIGW